MVASALKRLRGWPLADKIAYWSVPEPMSGCFLWWGHLDARGYGTTFHEGRTIKAHRAAWVVNHGPIPAGLLVRHRCDNPGCVNPDHLLLGTDRDNSDDKVNRRRHSFGKRIHTAVLSDEQIAVICADPRSNSALAREMGVHDSTISRVRSGGRWKHLARIEYEIAKAAAAEDAAHPAVAVAEPEGRSA